MSNKEESLEEISEDEGELQQDRDGAYQAEDIPKEEEQVTEQKEDTEVQDPQMLEEKDRLQRETEEIIQKIFPDKKKKPQTADERHQQLQQEKDEKAEIYEGYIGRARDIMKQMEEAYQADIEAKKNNKLPIHRLRFLRNELSHKMNQSTLANALYDCGLAHQFALWLSPDENGVHPVLSVREELINILDRHPVPREYLSDSGIYTALKNTPLLEGDKNEILKRTIMRRWERDVIGAKHVGKDSDEETDSDLNSDDRREESFIPTTQNIDPETQEKIMEASRGAISISTKSHKEQLIEERVRHRIHGQQAEDIVYKPAGIYLHAPVSIKQKKKRSRQVPRL